MKKLCTIPLESHLDYFEGRAETRNAQRVSQHLSEGCAVCTRNQNWIRDFMPALQGALQASGQTISSWALARAFAIMPAKPEPLRFVTIARLLLDSRVRVPGFATSRDWLEGSVHCVYRTDSADIDLWQEQNRAGNWFVTGQALSLADAEMPPPVAVSLEAAEGASQPATMEDSEFCFESVPGGRYSLRLLWDDLEIQVDDLMVGSVATP